MSAPSSLIGKRFNRLIVLERGNSTVRGSTQWMCRCDCGTDSVLIRGSDLKNGHTQSCGCLHNEDLANRCALPGGQSAKNRVLAQYKQSARARNLEWGLSEDIFYRLVQRNCHYCGDAPSRIVQPSNKYGNFVYNGIDRLDGDRGYVEDNCVTACRTCNTAKMTMTEEEFLQWIAKVYHHRLTSCKQAHPCGRLPA